MNDIKYNDYLYVSKISAFSHAIENDLTYNYTIMNEVIRNLLLRKHQPLNSGHILNDHVIQYMLRNNIISKVGDHINITLFHSIIK